MQIMEDYNSLINSIAINNRKYIHYQSLKNFIVQMTKTMSAEDLAETEKKVNEYLEIVKEDITNIDSQMGLELFQIYINPLGESLRKYGFSRVTPMKYLFLYSVMIDSLLYFALFHFPYPIMSIIVTVYYFLFRMRRYNANKVYGLFY